MTRKRLLGSDATTANVESCLAGLPALQLACYY